MKTLLFTLLTSILVTGIVCIPSLLILKYFDYKNRNKKSPLNRDLLRSPGQSLLEQINDMTTDLVANVAIFPLIPIILYTQLLNLCVFEKKQPSLFVIFIFGLFALGSLIYFSLKTIKILRERNKLRLAYECEVAVGQDLHNELTNGFKIYHDFPGDKFNIDHIAIGPTGVFAIETKGRSRAVKNENNNWIVTFNGEYLDFPGWKEKRPIEQSKMQANWLKQWIKKSTTEDIYVTPVLAIPHWLVTRKAPSDVLMYNGKNSKFLAQRKEVLTGKQIASISFQIEKECRDIKGKSYKK